MEALFAFNFMLGHNYCQSSVFETYFYILKTHIVKGCSQCIQFSHVLNLCNDLDHG